MTIERAPKGPQCAFCGKHLRPIYNTKHERYQVRVSVTNENTEDDPIYIRSDNKREAYDVLEDDDGLYCMRFKHRVASRTWTGEYESRYEFFCSVACAATYGMRACRQARRTR